MYFCVESVHGNVIKLPIPYVTLKMNDQEMEEMEVTAAISQLLKCKEVLIGDVIGNFNVLMRWASEHKNWKNRSYSHSVGRACRTKYTLCRQQAENHETKSQKHQHARDVVSDKQTDDQIEDQVLRKVKSEVDKLVGEQPNDPTLQNIWKETGTGDSRHVYADGLLYRLSSDQLGNDVQQLIIPKQRQNMAIHLSHIVPILGHHSYKRSNISIGLAWLGMSRKAA